MKRRRFPFLLIFLSVLTLLFSGCDVDSFAYITQDGSTVEYNTNSGTVTVDTPEESNAIDDEEHEDADDESDEDIDVADITDDEENLDKDEDNAEDLNEDSNDNVVEVTNELTVNEDGEYTSKDEVALYIHLYNHLPSNFITKNEAKELGWDSSKGNLNTVAPGKSIGGDKFGNREGLLPKKSGRVYYECDIDYKKGSRNAKRIVFSNDGLIYYTEDHYETYELLYGSE